MRKPLLILLAVLLALLLPAAALCEASENLLVNGSFDRLDSDGLPSGWYRDAWFTSEGYTVYGSSEDREETEESFSASIHNMGSNDARFAQTVEVEPESLYCLSGYIRAEDIPVEGWGANLSIEGLYAYTSGLYDTRGRWEYVAMYGETGEDQREVTVFARLGGYSGESRGMAWFDDLTLRKVDSLPEDTIAVRWYTQDNTYSWAEESDWDEEDEGTASPAWPWLVVLGLAYSGVCIACMSLFRRSLKEREEIAVNRGKTWFPAVILVLSALLHYVLAMRITGYQVDINCFLSWGNTIYTVGPARFYSTTSFCDYPPAYMLVLYLNTALTGLMERMGLVPGILTETAVIKLVPSLCDMGIAWLMYKMALRKGLDWKQAGTLAAMMAFNPVLVLNSAAWGQVDSALAILLVLVALCAMEGWWHLVMPCYMLSVLVKPQALMLGFLGLAAIILAWRRGEKDERRRMLRGLLLTAVCAACIIIPFSIGAEPGWLIQRYVDTLSSYAYASVNTANLYYLFGLNWHPITDVCELGPAAVLTITALAFGLISGSILRKKGARLFWLETVVNSVFALFFLLCAILGASWSVLGYGAIAFVVTGTTMLFVRGGKMEHLPLLGFLLFLMLYVLGIKMHERYLFPAIPLLVMALILTKDMRLLVLLVLSSFTMFLNEGIVLDNAIRLGAEHGHLNEDTRWLANILSAVNLMQIPLALWTCFDICLKEKTVGFKDVPQVFPAREVPRRSPLDFKPDVSLHWKRLDTVLILAVTAAYSVLGLTNLGSHKAPETVWTSTSPDEYVVLDLGEIHEDFSMLYYCQVSYNDFSVAVSDDGEAWSEEYYAQMDQGQCFRWMYLMPSYDNNGEISYSGGNTYHATQKLSGRYVRINALQPGLRLCEVLFRETVYTEKDDGTTAVTAGTVIPVSLHDWYGAFSDSPLYSSPENILDEQDSMEGEPCWYNGTYFDEIYHARTAYEHLTGSTTYETTHPPLGKVIISWFIGIFGMNPFGWRFAGALAGILMVPVMYLLGKQLTKRTDMALLSSLLISLDCMHYTQTRIATIDSFPVLFILLACYFMLRFMQRDISRDPLVSLLPDLACSGFFMGCAVASKWIGIYAGIGLAVLFFWTLGRHVCLSRESRKMLDAAKDTEEVSPELAARAESPLKRCLQLCLWCLLFFVLVPLVIYLLSYIPYFRYRSPGSLGEFIRLVWQAQEGMLSYHSTPRLGMDHPYYSPWYEWPVIARPMYYAMGYYTRPGSSFSIFCFGNPGIWWTGIVGIFVTLVVFVRRHRYMTEEGGNLLHLRSTSYSVNPAFVLLCLLAQFLPWVLVPRGTYIYHYFASVPFLILAIMLSINWLRERNPRIGAGVIGAYLLICLAFFVILFPYASGIQVSYGWLDLGKRILNVYYALPVG